jgi:hypothetical protein
MTRMTPFFAASALVAILTLGAGAAFAATSNGGGHPSGPGPSGPSGTSGGATLPRGENCAIRADQMGLAQPAWHAFVNRCQQTGA